MSSLTFLASFPLPDLEGDVCFEDLLSVFTVLSNSPESVALDFCPMDDGVFVGVFESLASVVLLSNLEERLLALDVEGAGVGMDCFPVLDAGVEDVDVVVVVEDGEDEDDDAAEVEGDGDAFDAPKVDDLSDGLEVCDDDEDDELDDDV